MNISGKPGEMGHDISKLEADGGALMGVNKKIGDRWDPSKSHKIVFRGKDDSYGRPPEGTKTAERAQKAINHINNQIINLVTVIMRIGTKDPETDRTYVTFGHLFEYYVPISDNVVGLLLRARRWHLLDFPGEMLYQRQDEKVIIRLLINKDELDKLKCSGVQKEDNSLTNGTTSIQQASNGPSADAAQTSFESKLTVKLRKI